MNRFARATMLAGMALGISMIPGRAAHAQVGTGANLGAVGLAASANPTLEVLIQSGATQAIAAVTDGVANAFPAPVQIVTQWNLKPGQASAIALVAYFTNPAQAMVSGANAIPSSWIMGRVATGTPTAFTAFTQNAVVAGASTVGTAGGSLLLYTQPINGQTKQGTRTDNLNLQLDLTGRRLLPGTYTGTLHIRAVVQ